MNIVLALWLRNLKIFVRNKVQLVMTIVMPFFFLYVFSGIFKSQAIENPLFYMLAGIVITNVFQTALTISSTTIDDIVSGFMKEVLVSPVKRMQIAAGQLLSAATISTAQGIVTLFVGVLIGLRFTSWVTPLAAIVGMAIVGLVFAGFGLFLAVLVKNAQTFQIVQAAVTMPMTFLCGAYIPLDPNILPKALLYVAYVNPMTYATAFFRTILLEKSGATTAEMLDAHIAFQFGDLLVTPWMSFVMILVFGGLFLLLSTAVFSRVDFSKMNRTKVNPDDIWA